CLGDLLLHLDSAEHGLGRRREASEAPIALGADDLAAMADEEVAHEGTVTGQDAAPLVVAQLLGEASGVGDVGEHHRDPFALGPRRDGRRLLGSTSLPGTTGLPALLPARRFGRMGL